MSVFLVVLLGIAMAGCTSGNGQFAPGGFGNSSGGGGGTGGTITVPPAGVVVTVSPASVSLAPGAQFRFTVTVTGAANTAVDWFVNGVPGGNATVGTISANGNYLAPAVAPNPNSVIITATSQQDPTKSATALAIITTPSTTVTVSASPAAISLQTGASTPFTASVAGSANMSVTWRVNGIPGGNATVGTITAAGVYTAPLTVPSPATVVVEAVSVADPSALGSAQVTIVQTVQVSVSPLFSSVGTLLTQQFAATVTGSTNTAVTWAVNGVNGGNATVGTIDAAGLYTGPANVPNPATVTLTARSQADPTAFSTATVAIFDSISVTVTVTPGGATLSTNQTQILAATVTGSYQGFPPSSAVQWNAGGVPGGNAAVGTIVVVTCPVAIPNTSCGLYTAPAGVPVPSQVTVQAFSITDPTASGMAILQITAPTAVTVTVSPGVASVQVSTAQQFSAMVAGTANQGVTWTATAGAITPAGLYTAPAAVPPGGTAMVCATSVVDTNATNCATVTILAAAPPPTITIAPTTASLRVNDQLQFTPTISGSATTTVTWRVNGIVGGNATVGTISTTGLYRAPAGVPAPATVSVTGSITDPNCVNPGAVCTSSAASVTINPQATISISPATTTVQTSLGAQFTTTVTGLANTAVVFLVSGVPGGNSAVGTITTAGLYVAPAALPTPNPVTITARSVADPTLTATATVTIVVPVVVTVAPATATIGLGATQQFTATVTGTANTAVTWRVNSIAGGNATVGTINASGLYTAPTNLLLTQSFSVSAVSVADPTASGNANVTVTVPVAVTVAPTVAAVQVGATQQFNASVTGSTNGNVTWSVNGIAGGNATVGTITTAGLYTAPSAVPAPNPVTVRATSVADPTKFANAAVTVNPGVAVSVAPLTATVNRGATQQFTATVTGTATTTVTWRVNGVVGGDPTVGTISAAGLYTAPTTLPTTQGFTITATSTVDPTAVGTAAVTVSVPISVTVSPSTQSVGVSTSQSFLATVSGTANQSVLWSVGGACAPNCGTIGMTSGIYTAPATVPAGTVTVTAASVADPTKTGTATVTVTANVAVSVSPSSATVTTGVTQQFTATVTGTATTTVNWSVNGVPGGNATVGTINAAGLYTAPAAVPSGSVTVTAASTVDPTATGSATVTVVQPITVTVAPAAATVQASQTQPFTATVTGSGNQMVNWSLSGASCAGSACGTISAAGVYTAPATPPASTVTVRATSVADPTKSGTAIVTIIPAPPPPPPGTVFVSVFPRGKLLPTGQSQQFTAHVIRTNNQAVTWSVNGIVGGNSTFGTIDAAGLYSPPSVRPSTPDITVRAVSVADPTASMTVNARIIPLVVVTPESAKVRTGTQQFTATVTGTSNTAVTWALNGVPGGNSAIGTISASGLYTRPPALVPPGLFTVTATSAADPNAVGVATLGMVAGALRIEPRTANVVPGAPVVFENTVHLLPPANTPGPLFTWRVNGTTGGSATVGTVSQAGVFNAPATPQTVTVQAVSTVDATQSSSSTLTVGVPTGASQVGLLSTARKIRPYDVVPVASLLTVQAAGNQYASFQVLVEGRSEDLTGVNVSTSDFTDGLGNRITASNATIYLEKFINVFYPSRDQGGIGEWPDPLIPKVDPFVGETRNAFPFAVNRISPVYKRYPRTGGDTSNTNLGAGRVAATGTYTGTRFKHYLIRIDQNGSVGSARFRWSDDGGATFQATNVATSGTPIALNDGVSITFQAGGIAGVTDFIANNEFWIFASPLRSQPVWVDVFVPANVPAGSYNGTVTVTRSGKANVVLNVQIDVKSFVLPLTAAIPAYAGMDWANLIQAHFLTTSGSQTLQLGHLYGSACLINRISCDTASAFPPTFTFNSTTGEVSSSNYTAYDQATAALANGSITPHGEQLSVIRLPRGGSTTSEQYFATDNLLTSLGTRGWRPRAFDFSFDEPGTPQDFRSAMTRTSLVRSVDVNLRALVTTDISQFGRNLTGYVNRWSPDWTTLDKKEFLFGGNSASRAFYDEAIAGGDELWWYGSCLSHDCTGTGASPRYDNLPTLTTDAPGILNRIWGLLGGSPYNIQGVLLQNSVLGYGRFFNMTQPRVDIWEGAYYQGGNGEGTLFYPGRPSDIGGTTHIPVESLRLKQIRDALTDMETVQLLHNRSVGDAITVDQLITNGLFLNVYTTNVDPSSFASQTTSIVNQAGAPPPPAPVNVPAAGGFFVDPVTGNKVWRLTDNAICVGGAKHQYSSWPVWNSTGTHLLAHCLNFQGSGRSTAVLFRDSDLSVVHDAMPPGSPAFSSPQLFWSPVDPNIFYATDNSRHVWAWNPFTRTGTIVADLNGQTVLGATITGATLESVSIDDRYFLLTVGGSGLNMLATFDRLAAPGNQLRGLDLAIYNFFDEAVLTKGNKVWSIGDLGGTLGFRSRAYAIDFSSFIEVSEAGHHAHGMLPNGTPVAIKAASNRDCPPGSASGIPGSSWRPTALILDETVSSTAQLNAGTDPLAAQVLKLGCNIPGQHHFGHFSWNNVQTDRFFLDASTYSPPGTDPIANSVLRVRLVFGPTGIVLSDQIDVLANYRTNISLGYFAQPRASCNQQGTRCLFASSMTVNTNKTDNILHLYIVDVP